LDLFASDKRAGIVVKAMELIETQAIVAGSRDGIWFIVSSGGTNTYVVDTDERSCTCKGYLHFERCYHLVAAEMLVDLNRKADWAWTPSTRG
jgi:hypothetical protein